MWNPNHATLSGGGGVKPEDKERRIEDASVTKKSGQEFNFWVLLFAVDAASRLVGVRGVGMRGPHGLLCHAVVDLDQLWGRRASMAVRRDGAPAWARG